VDREGPSSTAPLMHQAAVTHPVLLERSRVVLIPTAHNPGDDIAPVVHGLKQVFGVQDVSVLDTKDRVKADSAEFVAPLKQATFVSIDGGRQWRLADAYLGTRVERELRNVLKRGGVIAGNSAGASILASYQVRGDRSFLRRIAVGLHAG